MTSTLTLDAVALAVGPAHTPATSTRPVRWFDAYAAWLGGHVGADLATAPPGAAPSEPIGAVTSRLPSRCSWPVR